MRIEVQMFAAARELAGRETVLVDVGNIASAADVIAAIGQQIPELTAMLPSCRLAIDNSYVASEATVSASNEIALIPPVSGG